MKEKLELIYHLNNDSAWDEAIQLFVNLNDIPHDIQAIKMFSALIALLGRLYFDPPEILRAAHFVLRNLQKEITEEGLKDNSNFPPSQNSEEKIIDSYLKRLESFSYSDFSLEEFKKEFNENLEFPEYLYTLYIDDTLKATNDQKI